jgi:outer membrane protein assembly factor BamB
MADNGTTLVLVDGTTDGYTIDLATNAFALLVDPTGLFVGSDRVRYLDTFFIFNAPGTRNFYISLSNSVTFDPLYIAGKVGYADNLIAIEVMHREIWLIGEQTTEVWYDSGAADFPFSLVPGAFIQHGCVAKNSVCTQDLAVFWISKDPQGSAIVLMGSNYNVERISTHAIEHEFATYSTVSDAIGYVYQEEGHMFYVLNFPTADVTWVYDLSTKLWHQRAYLDSNGQEHRHRSNVFAHAYGTYVVGDWQNGNLYALDENNYTDNGVPIKRVRSFPHVVNELKRVIYRKFVADMQSGAQTDPNAPPPIVSLRWSDDRGASWGNPITQPIGAVGQFNQNIQFRRLGMSRDRVFELSWSAPIMTALNGAFVDVEESAS